QSTLGAVDRGLRETLKELSSRAQRGMTLRFHRRPPPFTEPPRQPLCTEVDCRPRGPVSTLVPMDLLWVPGRIVQALRLLRLDRAVVAAVDHEERPAGELTDGAKRIGRGTDDRLERRRVREIAAGCENDRAHSRVVRS